MCELCQSRYAEEHTAVVGPLCRGCGRFRLGEEYLEEPWASEISEARCYHCFAVVAGLEDCRRCRVDVN